MWNKTTKAIASNGSVTIMTDDAIEPNIVTFTSDQLRSGAFEIKQEGMEYALQFKPAGRKTADTVAVYDKQARAARAMKGIYKALSSRNGRSGGGFWSGFIKILGFLLVIGLIVFIVFMLVVNNMAKEMIASGTVDLSGASTSTAGSSAPLPAEDVELPVGEPFPAQDFINATKSQKPAPEAPANNPASDAEVLDDMAY